MVDCAALLTSELVTNAVLHARSPLQVRVAASRQSVHIEVHDGDPRALPAPVFPGSNAPSGRGLFLVDELATSWGTDRTPDGKLIWFTLEEE